MSRITMIAKKKTTAVIGASASVLLIAGLMLLPVIPVSLAGSTQAPTCGTGQWVPLFNQGGSPATDFIKFNNLSLGLSLVYQGIYRDSNGRYSNGSYHSWTTHTNQTLTLDLSGFKVAHDNGTVAKFALTEIINRSLDTYLKFRGLSIITKPINSTALRINLTVAHISLLEGKWASAHGGNTWGLPVGVPITLENMNMVWAYNCATSTAGYSMNGMSTGLNAIQAAISQRQTGALASSLFGASR